MAASPDDILQRILSQGDPNAPGLLGLVNKGTAPFGGAGNLGLQLLANSGYSSTPRSTGQVFAQSALNAQQFAAGAQEQQLKQQLIAAQLKALQAKPAVPTPQAIQEYEYAKQQGYTKSFAEWQRDQKTSYQTPSSIQDYEYAKGQGFTGSLMEYQKAQRAPEKADKPQLSIITRPTGEGMVQDFTFDSHTGERTPTGQPYSAANAKDSGLGGRESIMFQRVANSANSAATALQNISELPIGASTGVMGLGASPGHSVMASVRGALLNRIAPQEVQDYNTMLAGVSRNLSTIETAGLAPNGSITSSMDSIQLREGDTEITKLRKLAEMRQIIEKGIEPNLANPKLPPEQKELVRNIIKQAQGAIPFTQHDITELQRRQQSNPDFTLQDLIKQKGLGGGDIAHVNSDAEYAKLPSGTLFIGPDGKQRKKP